MREARARTPIVKVTTSATRTTFYTCPANSRAKVPLIYIVNANGTVSVTFEVFKASTSSYFFILAGKNLAMGETIQLSNSYIVLEPGDQLSVTCTGATVNVDALCTAEEIFIPVG